MANEKDFGVMIDPFETVKTDSTHSLKMGRQAPSDAVNIAYIHAPDVNVSENVGVIDMSTVANNVIPHTQMDSLVAADSTGKLEYVDILPNGEVQSRPPYQIFPSDQLSLTRHFNKNDTQTSNALYYVFDIQYHYDSDAGQPDKNGNYSIQRYNGSQIQVLDEGGSPLPDDFKYDIYVLPQKSNPNVFWVKIYLESTTDELNTITVRYNHVDRPLKNSELVNETRSVELYANKLNRVDPNGKYMIEGGKTRVINGESAMKKESAASVRQAQSSNQEKSVFATIEKKELDGFELIVPQKTERDSRKSQAFHHRVVAEYTDFDGVKQKVTSGIISDWVSSRGSLLDHEMYEYSDDWKKIGLPYSGRLLAMRELVEASLPIGTPSIPSTAQYRIEAGGASVNYNATTLSNNSNVQVAINEFVGDQTEAKAVNTQIEPWKNAMLSNAKLKASPISHRCTIFAEQQRTKWNFEFTIDGQGKVASGSKTITWKTEDNGYQVKVKGTIEYQNDGRVDINFSPTRIPQNIIPAFVKDFSWKNPSVPSSQNITVGVNAAQDITVTPKAPLITQIGTPVEIPVDLITKSEGLKTIASLYGAEGIYGALKIPSNIGRDEVLLRIERGNRSGSNKEYRVNYRFRCEKSGVIRFPVDQVQNQLGVNRLRLKGIGTDVDVKIVAWTSFEELEAVPVFGLRIENSKKMKVDHPKIEEEHQHLKNWYPRIRKGSFHKRITLPYFEKNSGENVPSLYVAYPALGDLISSNPDEQVEVDLEYTLPEYENQPFYESSLILVEKESPLRLDETTLQVQFTPIALTNSKGLNYIEVEAIRGHESRRLRVSDVDAAKGIIYLNDRVRDQDDVIVRYAYSEQYYTYRGFEKDGTFFHLDLNPTPGHKHTVAKNGFHRWIPINSDKERFTPEEAESVELIVKPVHIYLRPTAIRVVKEGKRQSSPVAGTTRTEAVFHTDEEHWFNPKDYKYDQSMLRLAKIIVQSNSNRNQDVVVLDTRTRGGGLDPAITREMINQIHPASLSHWDIGSFDGQMYMENGVFVIELPDSLKGDQGKPYTFTEGAIETAIAKHKVFGNLPLIEYYDPKERMREAGILLNSQFLDGQHLSYFDQKESTGTFSIIKTPMSSEKEAHVLRVEGDAEYQVLVPGYRIGSYIRIDVTALRERLANQRSLGRLEIDYEDGSRQNVQLDQATELQWHVYTKHIPIRSDVRVARLILNRSASSQKAGLLLFGSVQITNDIEITAQDEIHQV